VSARDPAPSPLTPPLIPPRSGPDRVLPPVPPGGFTPPAPDPSHFAPTPQMGGPLVVTSAGGTAVATDGMRAAIDRAAAVSEVLGRVLTAVHRAELVPGAPSLAGAEHAARAARTTAEHLHDGLIAAVERYSAAEQAAWAEFDAGMGVAGAALGELAGIQLRLGAALAAGIALPALALAGPGLAMLAAMRAGSRKTGSHAKGAKNAAGAKAAAKKGGEPGGIAGFLVDHPQLTSNPRFVAAVRGITDGMDEGLLAGVGVPPLLAAVLGATGRTGVGTSAGVLMGAGPAVGLLKESPVDVQRVQQTSVDAAPTGAAERLERVPEVNQVRIERYSAPGEDDRFVVYVGPTETFDPQPEGEPWDLASNVGGVGGQDVASIRATELAMADAGITTDSRVQLVGFSQGGMVATRIAADGNWSAVGLQTFGAPAGNVALPDGIQGMAVRNREDFVPALAGPQTDHHLLQVERTVYADPSQMPTDQAAPGHQRVAYAATAQAIDAARSSDVRTQSAALDDFTGDYADRPGATITSSLYHSTRRDGT
jgi:hypothetical protein